MRAGAAGEVEPFGPTLDDELSPSDVELIEGVLEDLDKAEGRPTRH